MYSLNSFLCHSSQNCRENDDEDIDVDSVAFVSGALMDWPASPTGFVVAATSSTTKNAGISQRTVTASDSDYASNTAIPCLRPIVPRALMIATSSSTSAAAAVGLRCDLTDSVTVNTAASSVGRVLIEEFYAATSVGCYLLGPSETGAS